MKSLIRPALLICLCYISVTAFSQIERKIDSLPMLGFITEEGKRCADATITLYEDNDVIYSFKTQRNGRFQLVLTANKYYTLEVTKQGYVQKRIAIDTEINNHTISVPVYECDLNIIPNHRFKGIDIGNLDFPMAIIRFEPKENEFLHNELYTSSMRTIYDGLLKEASTKNEIAMNQ